MFEENRNPIIFATKPLQIEKKIGCESCEKDKCALAFASRELRGLRLNKKTVTQRQLNKMVSREMLFQIKNVRGEN